MAAASPTYTKLPGRGLRRAAFAISATRCRLWLAEDHLLAVDYTVATEEYRRFYFRDIEAFVIRRTPRRQIWNWILLFFLLITVTPFVVAWRSEGQGGLALAAIGLAVFWSIFLLVNTLRGATCQTHIRTAAQLEQLPSLGRIPMARKILARLQPLILAAQGDTTSEEMATAPWMASSTSTARPAFRAETTPTVLPTDNGRRHGALFGLLIAEGLLTAVAFLFFHKPISMFSLLAMLAGFIVCVIASVRQSDTESAPAVRTMTKVALGYYIAKCLAGFVYTIIFAVRNPGNPMITGLEMIGEPGFEPIALAAAGAGTIIGVIGLIVLLGRKRAPSAGL